MGAYSNKYGIVNNTLCSSSVLRVVRTINYFLVPKPEFSHGDAA